MRIVCLTLIGNTWEPIVRQMLHDFVKEDGAELVVVKAVTNFRVELLKELRNPDVVGFVAFTMGTELTINAAVNEVCRMGPTYPIYWVRHVPSPSNTGAADVYRRVGSVADDNPPYYYRQLAAITRYMSLFKKT